MFEILIISAIATIASLTITYFASSKNAGFSAPTENLKESDLNFPTVDEGKFFPVVFGTRDVGDVVVIWYGNLKKVSNNYLLSMILGVCQSKTSLSIFINTRAKITRVSWGDKPCWLGEDVEFSGAFYTMLLQNKAAFENGDNINGYAFAQRGDQSVISGITGVTDVIDFNSSTWHCKGLDYVILNDVDLGTSPNLKSPTFRVVRTHSGWYDQKSTIQLNPITLNLELVSWEGGGQNYYGNFDNPSYGVPFTFKTIVTTYADFSQTIQISRELKVRIYINQVLIYEADFGPSLTHKINVEIPSKFIKDGANEFRFRCDSEADVGSIGYPQPQYLQTQPLFDMNPAHVIHDCLTDKDYGSGLLDSDIDLDSFIYAADTLYNEQMGVSIKWSKSSDINSFIKEICRHIDAVLYVDHKTGKFKLKLIRKDYNELELFVLDASNIVSITDWKRTSFDDLQNTVTATYFNTLSGCARGVTVSDVALVQDQGLTITNQVDFPAFSNADNASKAAQRQLITVSTALLSCTITSNPQAYDLDIGDAFKLNWTKYWPVPIIMRVGKINFGNTKNNQVVIEAVEDIFGTPASAYVK